MDFQGDGQKKKINSRRIIVKSTGNPKRSISSRKGIHFFPKKGYYLQKLVGRDSLYIISISLYGIRKSENVKVNAFFQFLLSM